MDPESSSPHSQELAIASVVPKNQSDAEASWNIL
jgi:hypothetical protein